MKNQKFLIVFYLFSSIIFLDSIKAQVDIPILQEGAEWTQGFTGSFPMTTTTFAYRKMQTLGDTTINGVDYEKMYYTLGSNIFDPLESQYFFAIREDEDGKIWVFPQFSESEYLFIDFGLEIGETALVQGANPFDGSGESLTTVLAKDSILINGEYRVRLEVQTSCITEYWIEGIGSTGGFLRNLDGCFLGGGQQDLFCHTIDGNLNYMADWIFSCKSPYELTISETTFSDQTICVGQQAVFQDFNSAVLGGVAGYNISIEPNVGVEQVNEFGAFLSPNETTNYTYLVEDAFGNSANVSFTVTVINDPIPDVEIMTSGFTDDCFVDSLQLSTNNEYTSYTWSAQGVIIGEEANLTIEQGGFFEIEVANNSGCTTTGSIYLDPYTPLNTNPIPEILMEPSNPCDGDVVTLSTKESYESYVWQTGETTASIQVSNPSGFYQMTVEVSNEFDCVGTNDFFGYSVTGYPTELPGIVEESGTLSATTVGWVSLYQWFLDGETIEEATDASYTPSVSGNYSVGISNAFPDFNCATFSTPLFVEVAIREVDITVFLEGPYNASNGTMSNDLLESGLLPLHHPYNTLPWDYSGGESMASYDEFPDNTIDWVLVEARTGVPNLQAPNTTLLETKVGLLLADGSIVGTDGGPLLFNQLTQENTHLVVRHRNHLDVMTAEPIPLEGTIELDLTTGGSQVLGPEMLKEMGDGFFAMYAGDYGPNGVIQNTDYDKWFDSPAQNLVFSLRDGNLDGVVQTTDYDIWFVNKAKLGVAEIQY